MNVTRGRILCAGAMLFACLEMTSAASANVLVNGFSGLGQLVPPGALPPQSQSFAASGDGHTIVGQSLSNLAFTPVYWEDLNTPTAFAGAATSGQANGVSTDGSVIAGNAGSTAFRYTKNGAFQNLGTLSGRSTSVGNGISGDGATVVGSATGGGPALPFKWTQLNGIQQLGLPADILGAQATAANENGSTIVGAGVHITHGFTSSEAIRWDNGSPVLLGFIGGAGLAPFAQSVPYDINADGTVIVGNGTSNIGTQAFRWEATQMIGLGKLPGASGSTATDVSADGKIVAGNSTGSTPWVWTANTGMRNLLAIFEEHEFDLTGWSIGSITGMSDNGRVLTGTGTHNGLTEAWRAVVAGDIGIALVGQREFAFSDAMTSGDGNVSHLMTGVAHHLGATSTGTLNEVSSESSRMFVFEPDSTETAPIKTMIDALLDGLVTISPGGSASVTAMVELLDMSSGVVATETVMLDFVEGSFTIDELFNLMPMLTPGQKYTLNTSLDIAVLNGTADFGNTFIVEFVEAVIPEPTTFALLGGAMLATLRRRR